MKYVPLITIVITIIVLLSGNYSRRKKSRRLQQLRGRWGKPNADYYNFERIEKYFLVNTEQPFHTLSQQTKNDIDFNELFIFLDRTNSKVGQQYLFDRLSRPSNDIAALQQLNVQADFFTTNQSAREEAQELLAALNEENAYHIASLLSGELPAKPAWFKLVIADIAVTLILIGLSFHFKVLLAWLMLPLAVNLALHYWNKNNTFYFAASLPQLNRLLNTCKQFSKKEGPFNNDATTRGIRALKKFQRTMGLLGLRQSNINPDAALVLYYLIDMIKAFFLVELIAFFSLVKELKNNQAAIRDLFGYAGGIDMALSVASLRAAGLQTCVPVFSAAEKSMEFKRIVHPLIENCVTNDINVSGKSILITGSNMSGKTSFLRTVAINTLLAQTLYTCFAESYVAPIVKLHSSIRIDDNLLEGKSYYFEEVNIMAGLVNAVASDCQHMFMLDEVFKGTNTVERIASAKAILSYLNKNNNIVFVSTHDIELSGMLKEAYDLYHFEENITNDLLQFDHILRQGPLTTRNAIKILALSGYPAEIVQEANEISNTLTTAGIAATQ
ncbi:MAG: hypothetical protein ABIU63_00620 [Chitinophagaceae bacterium]